MTPEKGPQSDEMVPPSLTHTKTQDRAVDRLWLAGMAMQGLVHAGGGDAHEIARQSYLMADVMLEVGGL